jgi:hypothetical protein
MIQVGRGTMTIFLFMSDEPGDPKGVSLMLTESVSHLEIPVR